VTVAAGLHSGVSLSVVVPVYGCAGCLEDLVDRVHAALLTHCADFELILVDDASPDAAWLRIVELQRSRPWLRGIRLSRNFGQHSAISAGLASVRCDWVAVMDCDLQDVPEELPKLLSKAIDENLDVVFAQRTQRKDGVLKRLGSASFFIILAWLTGVPQDASSANFGVYRRKVVEAVNAMPERDRTFPLMVKWSGFRISYLPVVHEPRRNGGSTYDLLRLLRLATSIILGYSDKPLRLVAIAGLGFSIVALAMVCLSVWKWLGGEIQVAGFTSLIASIWLVGGAIMFALGVVGLYVGQIFKNVQGRPSYIVQESVGLRPGSAP